MTRGAPAPAATAPSASAPAGATDQSRDRRQTPSVLSAVSVPAQQLRFVGNERFAFRRIGTICQGLSPWFLPMPRT